MLEVLKRVEVALFWERVCFWISFWVSVSTEFRDTLLFIVDADSELFVEYSLLSC